MSDLGGTSFSIRVDGVEVGAQEGDTVAAALLRAGIRTLHWTHQGAPRSVFCGIGSCYDCYTTIDGIRHERSCLAMARPGMRVETNDSTPKGGSAPRGDLADETARPEIQGT